MKREPSTVSNLHLTPNNKTSFINTVEIILIEEQATSLEMPDNLNEIVILNGRDVDFTGKFFSVNLLKIYLDF